MTCNVMAFLKGGISFLFSEIMEYFKNKIFDLEFLKFTGSLCAITGEILKKVSSNMYAFFGLCKFEFGRNQIPE